MPTFRESPGTIRFDGRTQANADALFLLWRERAGGFYLNYFSTKASLTHWWACDHLGTNEGIRTGTRSATSYPKFCARTLRELQDWAGVNGFKTRPCKTCRPEEHAHEAATAADYQATLFGISEQTVPFGQPEGQTPPVVDGSPPVVPSRVLVTRAEFLRNTTHASKVKSFYDGACQLCGYKIVLPGGLPYAEAHHVWPLNEGGGDGLGNLLCVCPTCHKELDYRVKPLNFAVLKLDPRHGFQERNVAYHNRKFDELSHR